MDSDGTKFAIPYVAYAPNININVLSLNQLILQGFEVNLKDTTCTITHMCVSRHNEGRSQDDSNLVNKTGDETKDSMEEQRLEIGGRLISLHVENFEGFIRFMGFANDDRICGKNKRLFAKKFEEAIGWFHEMKNEIKLALPPYLAGIDVCLFDLHKLISSSGGYDLVTRKKDWNEMAMCFGYPDGYGEELHDLYDRYLLAPQ